MNMGQGGAGIGVPVSVAWSVTKSEIEDYNYMSI